MRANITNNTHNELKERIGNIPVSVVRSSDTMIQSVYYLKVIPDYYKYIPYTINLWAILKY